MISKFDVLLHRCVRLAMGAEWEPSGANAKTDVFRTLVLSIVYVLLHRCVRLAMRAEWEPSGADAKTDVFRALVKCYPSCTFYCRGVCV